MKRRLECKNSCEDDKSLEPFFSKIIAVMKFIQALISQMLLYTSVQGNSREFCLTVGRNRNFIRTRKLLGNVQVLTAQQPFTSSTEAVSLFFFRLPLLGWIVMNKKTIPLPSDVEYKTVMIFHLLKMLFRNSNP